MNYKTKDLAIIIPTKDRPDEVKRHLDSISDQGCSIGRIIIVASGYDIKNMVIKFRKNLPVEYYRSEPGQIRQRNLGIKKLDASTKLVACMDDDVTYYKGAIKEMIRFWNTVEENTAGIGFNIVNLPNTNHNFIRGALGFSSKMPGRVLRSGFNTSISNVSENILVEWLNGGSSVWKQEVLLKYPLKEINTRWAVCEDLIFSYPIGKIHSLYICANAKVESDEEIPDRSANEFYKYRGTAEYLWRLFFVMQNKDLSVYSFMLNKLLYCIVQLVKGCVFLDKSKIYTVIGILKAFFKSLKLLFGLQTLDNYKIEYIDSLD